MSGTSDKRMKRKILAAFLALVLQVLAIPVAKADMIIRLTFSIDIKFLLLTIIVEYLASIFLLKFFKLERINKLKLLLVIVFSNLTSFPLVWLLSIQSFLMLLVGEVIAVFLEGLLITALIKIPIQKSMVFSFYLNLFSFVAGIIIILISFMLPSLFEPPYPRGVDRPICYSQLLDVCGGAKKFSKVNKNCLVFEEIANYCEDCILKDCTTLDISCCDSYRCCEFVRRNVS